MNPMSSFRDFFAAFWRSLEMRGCPQLQPICPSLARNQMKFRALFVSSLLLPLCVTSVQAADSLQLFKNYFDTGHYVVGGVALRGLGIPNNAIAGGVGSYATGVIHMNGVPQGADIVAAYLYWETISGTSV